jgi:large subunit ribosomal protein L3
MLGLIGKKLGMSSVFDDNGNQTAVTVIEIAPNTVVRQRTPERDGYAAVVLGSGKRRAVRVTKPYAGQFPQGLEPAAVLTEVRDFGRDVKVGDRLGVEAFEGVHFVDVRGVSKGKGFQGVMRRFGFGGGRKSHGSLVHREPGSTGQAGAKTFPGRKMPGRMGAERRTVQNLRLVKIDQEKGLLMVKGAVPGRTGGTLLVAAAKKKQ